MESEMHTIHFTDEQFEMLRNADKDRYSMRVGGISFVGLPVGKNIYEQLSMDENAGTVSFDKSQPRAPPIYNQSG